MNTETLRRLLYSLGGRKFILAICGALVPWINHKFGIGLDLYEVCGILGVLATFILGESYVDGRPDYSSEPIALGIDGNPPPTEIPERAGPPIAKYGMLLILALPVLGMCSGCYSTQAARTAQSIEDSAISYDKNITQLLGAFIKDYHDGQIAEVDEIANKAIAAEIKPDGNANAINLQLIMTKKLQGYAAVEKKVQEMRNKFAAAKPDMDNILKYSEGLKAYYANKAKSADILNQGTDAALALFTQYATGKAPAAK